MNNILINEIDELSSSVNNEDDNNTGSHVLPTKRRAVCYSHSDIFTDEFSDEINDKYSKLNLSPKSDYMPGNFVIVGHQGGFSFNEDYCNFITPLSTFPYGEFYNSVIVDPIERETTSKLNIVLKSIVKKLISFKDLQPGWDTYHAKSINIITITNAIDIISRIISDENIIDNKNIPIPFVAPLADGGILFELSTLYKEIEFTVPEEEKQPFEYLINWKFPFSEKEGEANSSKEIIDIVADWLYDQYE